MDSMPHSRWWRSPEMRLWTAAVGLRLALIALAAMSASQLATLRFSDAESFLKVAEALLDRANLAKLTFYDTRVFPFWPACEAGLLALGLPPPSVLALTVLLAGAVPVLYYRLSGNFAFALTLAFCPPAWLLSTILAFSEACYLALGLAAALSVFHRRYTLAGICAGAMVSTRPFGVAWVAPLLIVALWESRRAARFRPALSLAGGLVIGVLPFVAVNLWLYGDILRQVHVYSAPLNELNLDAVSYQALGQPSGHWGIPFYHVLLTPWRVPVPLWKVLYIYAHVIAILILVPVAISQLRRGWQDDLGRARWCLLGSFVANSALIVSTGPYWAFHTFDRYFVWGLPGAILALESLIPVRPWRWLLPLIGASLVAATIGILHRVR